MVVLAGGSNSFKYLSEVEVYSPSSSCNRLLAPLPMRTLDPILFFSAGMLLACGGKHEFGPSDRRCLRFLPEGERGRWVHAGPALNMHELREESAYTQSPDGRFYVTGGMYAPRSVEYFDPATKRWARGSDMAAPKRGHCAVAAPSPVGGAGVAMMMLGGQRSRGVERLDPSTGRWQHGTDLFTYRQYRNTLTYLGKRTHEN